MSVSFNKVLLVGNLTRDPEVKFMASGAPWARTSLAVNRSWKDREGKEKEEVSFFDLVAYEKRAESMGKYARKGRKLLVDGRLSARTVVDDKGQKRTFTDVIVNGFQFLDHAKHDEAAANGGQSRGVRGAASDLPGPGGSDDEDE